MTFSLIGVSLMSTSCGRRQPETAIKEQSLLDPCSDLSDLNHTELETRQQLAYVNQSSFSDRTCVNCKLFIKTDKSFSCGSCLVMKGPVEDSGYCTVWAPLDV